MVKGKRALTNAEEKRIRNDFQTILPHITSLIDNKMIDSQSKSDLKKVRKCLIDANSYFSRVVYTKGTYDAHKKSKVTYIWK